MIRYKHFILRIRVVLLLSLGLSLLFWGSHKWVVAGFPITQKNANIHGYLETTGSEELIYMLLGCILCFCALGDYAFNKIKTTASSSKRSENK
jgi:hypothetical protein